MTSTAFRLSFLAVWVFLAGVELQAQTQTQFVNVRWGQEFQDDLILAKGPGERSRAVLFRNNNSVLVRVQTTGLPAGAYTTWWIVFNNPKACNAPCDFPEDFFDPAVATSAVWAAGGIVGEDGAANFEAKLEVGSLPGKPCPAADELFTDPKVPIGCGLLNPRGAEIHFILKTHGPLQEDTEVLYRQLSSIGGACTDPEGPVAHPVDPDPDMRVFPCYDPQVAVFPAP